MAAKAKEWKMKECLSDGELGWAAGCIDGEGTIGIYKRSSRVAIEGKGLFLHVSICNTDIRMPLKLRELFGGNFSNCTKDKRPNRRPLFIWTITGRHATAVLKKIKPFLVIKKEQAEIGIAFAATMSSRGPLSEEVRQQRIALSENVKQLKVVYPEAVRG